MAKSDDSKSELAHLEEDELREEKGRAVVMRMMEHAYRVLNLEMDDFFAQHLDTFEQDSEDFSNGRGETLEQYAVFQKYIAELERHFDKFAEGEGFKSSREAFDFIQGAVSEDLVRQEENMKSIQAAIEAMQRHWEESRTDAVSAKGSDPVSIQEGPRAAWVEAVAEPVAESKNIDETKDTNVDNELPVKATLDESKTSQDEGKEAEEGSGVSLKVGSEVEVFGLQSRPELNNRTGVIVELVSDILYTVVLYPIIEKGEKSGCEYRVKLRNLRGTSNKSIDLPLAKKLQQEAREHAAQAKAKESASATVATPIIMFSQPVPLESLIQQVLNIGDYKTFSVIMRMKVKEREMGRLMNQKLKELEESSISRREQFSELPMLSDMSSQLKMLESHYQSLRNRFMELTPSRSDLNEETSKQLSDEVWQVMVRGGGVDGVSKQKLMDVVKFVFEKRLSMLCSPNEKPGIEVEGREVMDATWEKSFVEVMTMTLRYAHLRIDSIKKYTIELFQAHANAIASVKQQAKQRLIGQSRAEAK